MTSSDERVRPALSGLAMAVDYLDKTSIDFDSLTVEEAAEHLAVLKEDIGRLRQLEAGLERWVAECFKAEGWFDPREFPGLGVVEVRRSKTRRAWDHEAAASAFVNAVVEQSGGEVLDPFEFMARIRSAASVNGWKVGGFKALGLDVDDFCSSSPGTPTVQITRGEK